MQKSIAKNKEAALFWLLLLVLILTCAKIEFDKIELDADIMELQNRIAIINNKKSPPAKPESRILEKHQIFVRSYFL